MKNQIKSEKVRVNNMDDKKIIKKQKIAITILSIITFCCLATTIGGLIYQNIEKNKIEIKFTNKYTLENSLYYYCELELLCKQDKIFNVNDFTFIRNNQNVCVSQIKVGDKIYKSNENFVINKYDKTKITLYLTLIEESSVSTIYYNLSPINYRESNKYNYKKNKVYQTTLLFCYINYYSIIY